MTVVDDVLSTVEPGRHAPQAKAPTEEGTLVPTSTRTPTGKARTYHRDEGLRSDRDDGGATRRYHTVLTGVCCDCEGASMPNLLRCSPCRSKHVVAMRSAPKCRCCGIRRVTNADRCNARKCREVPT